MDKKKDQLSEMNDRNNCNIDNTNADQLFDNFEQVLSDKDSNLNNEFKAFMPGLAEVEYKLLEDSIIKDGCRDAVVVWNGCVVDGHNRYEICQKHNIPFRTTEMNFTSTEEAKLWVIDNQLGRRNLNDWAKVELAEKEKAILNEAGRDKRKRSLRQYQTNTSVISETDKTDKTVNTQKYIAEKLGWSTGKQAKAEYVWKHKNEEEKQMLKENNLTIDKAYTQLKSREKRLKVEQKANEWEAAQIGDTSKFVDIYKTDNKYNIIYADPPWQYWEGGNRNQSLHYQTMTVEEIKALPIDRIAEENCILFLWVTYPILYEALEVFSAWGFKYSTCGFNWSKRNKHKDTPFLGCGSWTRANSEPCLIGLKGQITRIDPSISQILDDPVMKHSEKPKRVRELITRLVGKLPRIELFSRNTDEDGWHNWGMNT